MIGSFAVAVGNLSEEPYASIVCYPRRSEAELERRLMELRRLGIETLVFGGEKQVSNVRILGKGCVGLVAAARRANELVALKIRRTDADRYGMQNEAKLLKKANSVQVGPRLLDVSRNFLVMQFIRGDLIQEWLRKCRTRTRIRGVLREVLEQCWRLDDLGLDHGELSHAPKHLVVSEKDEPFIVDFETASLNRRPANVTSMYQFLFIGSEAARKLNQKLGLVDKQAIVNALRLYKADRTRRSFENVLKTCGFQTT